MDAITPEKEVVLNRFWEQGMRKGTSELIKDAAIETQCTTADIKKWASVKERNLKKEGQKKKPKPTQRKKKAPLRKKRGFDLFISEFLAKRALQDKGDRSNRMKEANKAWNTLTKEEHMEYNRRAARMNETVVPVGTGVEKLKKMCKQLWESGVMVTMLWPNEDGEDLEVYCPPSANSYWQKVQPKVQGYAELWHRGKGKGSSSNGLRMEVQDLFNTCYQKATGRLHKPCEYCLLDTGELQAFGLPEGILLKRPSAYSVPEKKAILAIKDQLKFEVRPLSASTSEGTELHRVIEDAKETESSAANAHKASDDIQGNSEDVTRTDDMPDDREVQDIDVPMSDEQLATAETIENVAPEEEPSLNNTELDDTMQAGQWSVLLTVGENGILVEKEAEAVPDDTEVEDMDAPTAEEQLATAESIAKAQEENQMLGENVQQASAKRGKRKKDGEGKEKKAKKQKAGRKQPLHTLENFWSNGGNK